ncbi:MAG: uracil-DNA glycosylase [Thermoanaerobaculia bacterium]|nr:uracil-DNA glycosylase [Thermoanaerobaculia bacterium]
MDDFLRHELEFLRDAGFTELDLNEAAPGERPSNDDSPKVETDASVEFAALKEEALACTRCPLAATRTHVVFGTGNPHADLMFVGEAPGRDEDLQGEPFVGRAGQLLTDIIRAMTLERDQVYIANVIKCRPPGNRNPEPAEIESCRPYLQGQIEMIGPRVIVTLGKFAFQTLLGTEEPISRARGRWRQLGKVRVMPTYHPAYLLRNPSAKKDVWGDMKQVMGELGLEISAGRSARQ